MPISDTVKRLSDFTRTFAEQSLNGQYGRALAKDFCALVDTQGIGRDDRQLPQVLLKVHGNSPVGIAASHRHGGQQQALGHCGAGTHPAH